MEWRNTPEKKTLPKVVHTHVIAGYFRASARNAPFFFCLSHTCTFQLLDKLWTQVSSLLPPGSCLQFLSRIRRVQQPHCLSSFHRVLLTRALAFTANQFVRKKKSPRISTSMHSGGFELTKLTCTRLKDNLIRHRGDRLCTWYRQSCIDNLTFGKGTATLVV